MADDSGRRGDDDETPVDPPTGEGDVVGADWLLSQLDGEPTGQMDAVRPASHDADDAQPENTEKTGKADRPVMAWWREKLIAAEAIVNPEARTPKETDGEPTDSPEQSSSNSEQGSSNEPDMPEPAQFEPRRADPVIDAEPAVEAERTQDDDFTFVPEPAFAPPPAPAPAPVFTPEPLIVENDDDDDDAETPADEAETGLIPSAEPPLFKPRSAREHIVEEEAQSDYVIPASSPAPELTDDEPIADEPIIDEPIADEPMAGNSFDEPENQTEDLDNFSWKLSPNDALDPLVHKEGSATSPEDASDFRSDEVPARDATAVLPVQAAQPTDTDEADSSDNDTDTGLPSRRQLRQEAEQQAPEPVIIPPVAGPAITPGPRRKSAVATPAAAAAAADSTGGSDEPPMDRPARPAAARAPRAVVIAAIALVAILVLGGLFFLGSQLPRLLAGPAPTETASPSPTPTETATPTPTAPAAPVGPAAPGEQDWTALGGGECLEPYSTPWAETFTVVDCGAGHTAQMVFTAPVDADPAAAYPGEEAILAQISLWCSAPGVLNAEAAGEYDDLQVQGTYPVTEEQWASGERNYYCFVSRSSGEQLTGSLATAQG